MTIRKPQKTATRPSMTVIQVALLQAQDPTVNCRYRGAPIARAHAGPELLGRPIEEVDHSDFESSIARYKVGRPKKDTGHRLICDLNTLLRWAIEKGYRVRPFLSFRTPPTKCMDDRYLSRDELTQIVQTIDRDFHAQFEERLVLRGLACLGLGVQEAACFSLKRVDFQRWEYIQDDESGRLRLIPIPMDMRAFLAKARQETMTNVKFKLDGRRIFTAQELGKMVADIGKRQNISGLTPILLSRSFTFG